MSANFDDRSALRAEMDRENDISRELMTELAQTRDLDLYLRGAIGVIPSHFRKALMRAAPVTLMNVRCFVVGYLARNSLIGEREISRVAELAYESLPWRKDLWTRLNN